MRIAPTCLEHLRAPGTSAWWSGSDRKRCRPTFAVELQLRFDALAVTYRRALPAHGLT